MLRIGSAGAYLDSFDGVFHMTGAKAYAKIGRCRGVP